MFAIKFWLTLNLAFFHLSQLLLFHVSPGSCKHDFPSGSRYKAKAMKESVGIQASCFWCLALRNILELKRKVIGLLEFSYLSFTFSLTAPMESPKTWFRWRSDGISWSSAVRWLQRVFLLLLTQSCRFPKSKWGGQVCRSLSVSTRAQPSPLF